MLIPVLCIYVVGALITAGSLPNGIRDEMEGIGDLFQVIFWPIVMPIKIAVMVGKFLFNIGSMFRSKK